MSMTSTGIGPFLRPAANFSIAPFWNLTCGPSKITSTSSNTLGASENGFFYKKMYNIFYIDILEVFYETTCCK